MGTPQPVRADDFVREARSSDAADITRVQVATWRSGYRDLVPAAVLAELTGAQAQQRMQEHWAASVASPPTSRHRVLVAVTAGGGGSPLVAGFASFGPAIDPGLWAGTDAELYELCVDPGQARRGHGSRLLNAAAAAMNGDGFATAFAWVLEGDPAALGFLESAGWARDGGRRDLDMGTRVPAVRLHTRLSP